MLCVARAGAARRVRLVPGRPRRLRLSVLAGSVCGLQPAHEGTQRGESCARWQSAAQPGHASARRAFAFAKAFGALPGHEAVRWSDFCAGGPFAEEKTGAVPGRADAGRVRFVPDVGRGAVTVCCVQTCYRSLRALRVCLGHSSSWLLAGRPRMLGYLLRPRYQTSRIVQDWWLIGLRGIARRGNVGRSAERAATRKVAEQGAAALLRDIPT
ncbi:hypothetical protein PsYK624_033200 [Phanerochaete sordida]|uniref:Uncharacterized protein n=1 Tax=Phanerochaete sordida TaxID=48140 RepID=A0A9P3LAX1_9APHY|nr:hypothetical protein PsYK624_033200 [Phanerochaete sordida]